MWTCSLTLMETVSTTRSQALLCPRLTETVPDVVGNRIPRDPSLPGVMAKFVDVNGDGLKQIARAQRERHR